jgi:peroxiredoxin
LKTIHPLTTAGLGLLTASVALIFSGYPAVAAGISVAGYMFTFSEVPKYSSWYQFIMLPLQGFVLGFAIDQLHPGFPAFSVIMTLSGVTGLLRLIFSNQMLHTKFLWVEPVLTLIGIGGYFFFNIEGHYGWQSWFYPVVPYAFNIYLFQGFVFEGIHLNKLAKNSGMIEVGNLAPDFELFDQFSQPVKLSSFNGKRNVLLIFIRGEWCPSCHMMLRNYERNREKLQNKNVILLAIGPDAFDTNRDLAEKLGIDYRILSDTKQITAQVYGVHQEKDPIENKLRKTYESGLQTPSSFLICDKGIIRYHSRADRAGELLKPNLIFEELAKLN